MTELTYTVPVTGEKVTVAEPLVDTALTEIKTVVNGKLGGINVEKELTGLRLIGQFRLSFEQKKAAGTYYCGSGGNSTYKITEGREVQVVTCNASDYAVASKTTKMVLKADLITNGTAPAANFTVALYPVESPKGEAPNLEFVAGAVIAESETTFAAPAAEKLLTAKTAFNFPATATYVVGVKNSAETATKSIVIVAVQLFVKNE